MKRLLLFLLLLSYSLCLTAQKPKKPSTSEIYESIKKLNFLGSVLYLAAHPDDENTRLIAYFSNKVKARTAYLAITRGDGGQNLIGPELRELLGVIRTQELLAARRIDGGEQFFTRANDFGYSKHPDETLQLWNKNEVLKDVVTIIRKFQPDVIINRFNVESAGKTHGHHTSSAILSTEAFDLAGKADFKSHGLYKPWQPTRLFFNTTWWFYGSKEKFDKADKSKMLYVDTGVYYPSSGLSNSEMASLSRSQHRSQGFGSTGTRGTQKEYVELLKGTFPKNGNIFGGINTTWTRVQGGEAIGKILKGVEQQFDFKNPAASIPELLKAYTLINTLQDAHWKNLKLKQIKSIIAACAGLYLEAVADTPGSYPGEKISFAIETINRSEVAMKLKSVQITPLEISEELNQKLENNKRKNFTFKGIIPKNSKYTNPYWLNKDGSLGMYQVADLHLIGNPETPRAVEVVFNVEIAGVPVDFQKDVVYKFNSPVKGEVYRPFEIIPEVTAHISDKVFIFADANAKEIPVTITAHKDNFTGTVSLLYPKGWNCSPKEIAVSIPQKGAEQTVIFKVIPPNYQAEGTLSVKVSNGHATFTKELVTIDYDHILKQTVLLPAKAKIVRLDIQKKGQVIGYIQGAGDGIPTSLRQIGYTVIELDDKAITAENLKNFDAVILGIRAYNVSERAKFYQKELFHYIENGGTLITQYNTSFRTKVDSVAPYHLRLSRDRVVDENAKVTLLNSRHELLNYPNKIVASDFDGWVQERGLYFPDEWGKEFTPLLSMHDKGEKAKNGSLLIANYGKGHFIYTGLSFFRELPAGVPGAYKLFANMLSIGKNNIKKPLKN